MLWVLAEPAPEGPWCWDRHGFGPQRNTQRLVPPTPCHLGLAGMRGVTLRGRGEDPPCRTTPPAPGGGEGLGGMGWWWGHRHGHWVAGGPVAHIARASVTGPRRASAVTPAGRARGRLAAPTPCARGLGSVAELTSVVWQEEPPRACPGRNPPPVQPPGVGAPRGVGCDGSRGGVGGDRMGHLVSPPLHTPRSARGLDARWG